jgi:hypothetical protein
MHATPRTAIIGAGMGREVAGTVESVGPTPDQCELILSAYRSIRL